MRQKVLIIFLVVIITTGSLVLPKRSSAFLGIGDITSDIGAFFQRVSSQLYTVGKDIKKKIGDELIDMAVQRIISQMVQDTANWIEGGGKPLFVTDWEKFRKKAGDIAFDQVVKSVGLSAICSPFKARVMVTLMPSVKFQDQISCTLDQVVSNIQSFYNDFRNGGWIAYNQSFGFNNNYYGVTLMVQDRILAETAKKQKAQENEAIAGQGFLSAKVCIEKDEEGNCLTEYITTPGSIAPQLVAVGAQSQADWVINAKTWKGQLTAALVNRITKDAVGLARSGVQKAIEEITEERRVQGLDYGTTPEYQSFSAGDIQETKQEMIAQLQAFNNPDFWNYAVEVKSDTFSYASLFFYGVTKIRDAVDAGNNNSGCHLPFGFNYRPQRAESEVKRLNNEINSFRDKLGTKIQEAQQLIEQIDSANTIEDLVRARQAYNSFVNSYDDTNFSIQNVETLSQSAEGEYKSIQRLWQDIDDRYEDCYDVEIGDGSDLNDPKLRGTVEKAAIFVGDFLSPTGPINSTSTPASATSTAQ